MFRKVLLLFCLLTGVHARLLAVDVTLASSAAVAELNTMSAISRLLHGELFRRSRWDAIDSGEIAPDLRWRVILGLGIEVFSRR